MADKTGEVVALAVQAFPGDPADLVVLAIGIVVAELRVADLVAGENQRQALREQQTSELVFSQAPPQRDDFRIVGRTFNAAIVAQVVVGAVAIVLAIGLVVLFVVAEQVGERKTVMHRDMINSGAQRAAVMVKQIGRSGHAIGYLADQASLATPVSPQRAAITVVPFRPLRRKR